MSEPRRVLLTSQVGDVHVDLATVAYVRFNAPEPDNPLSIHVACRSGDWFQVYDSAENRAALIPVLVANAAILHSACPDHEHEWSNVIENGYRHCRQKNCRQMLAVPPQ